MVTTEEFKKELAQLINKHSLENQVGNTSDFIIADYLIVCLANLHIAITERERWYGNPLTPHPNVSNL